MKHYGGLRETFRSPTKYIFVTLFRNTCMTQPTYSKQRKAKMERLLHRLIKRVAKRAVTLLIIISLFISHISGLSQSKIDSNGLKRELDGVLKKYGLKTTGFAINVISLNQWGGQTAYSITNNYYSDPNYVPDSLNFSFKIETIQGKKTLMVSPLHGSWTLPFALYDSSKGIPKGVFYFGPVDTMRLPLDNNLMHLKLIGFRMGIACGPSAPIAIDMSNDPNGIFGFGDSSDKNKMKWSLFDQTRNNRHVLFYLTIYY